MHAAGCRRVWFMTFFVDAVEDWWIIVKPAAMIQECSIMAHHHGGMHQMSIVYVGFVGLPGWRTIVKSTRPHVARSMLTHTPPDVSGRGMLQTSSSQ